MAQNKLKVMLLGIAGTSRDFLLALHTIKCFVCQDEEVKNNSDVIIKQYYYVPPDKIATGSVSIINDIKEINPDVIAFSCYVWNIDAVIQICKILKDEKPEIKIIFGGPEITAGDAASGRFNDANAHFLVFGEGEKKFLKLIKYFINKNENYQEIYGIAYKKDNKFMINFSDTPLDNIDKIPSAYLTGFVEDEILSRKDIRVNIETQRGCNFRCAYCLYHKDFPKVKYRDPNVVIDEIEFANKKGIKMGRIVDANFLSDKKFAKTILRGLIERKVKMALFMEMIPIYVDREMADLFGEYIRISPENKVTIGMGVQTITQESLEAIRRKIPVRFFENAFDSLLDNNVIIKTDLILGLPHETHESFLKTMEFVSEKLRRGTNYLSISLLMVLPGTEIVDIAKRENFVIDTRDSSHFIWSTPTMSRDEIVHLLKLSITAYRILNAMDIPERIKIRDLYFKVKDELKATNIQMLEYLSSAFFSYLDEKGIDYKREDFTAEEYYKNVNCKDIFIHIPDEFVVETLSKLNDINGVLLGVMPKIKVEK